MSDVKWIKFKVGTFDGSSFKKIKRARLQDGTSYRDRLTSIWFELLDLAGNRNLDGQLVRVEDLELPYDAEAQFEDIATMIDRPVEEVECAIAWFVKNNMVVVIDNLYYLSNWSKYQSVVSLDNVREKNRLRQKRYYDKQKMIENNINENEPNTTDNVSPNVRLTSSNASRIKNKEYKNKEYKNKEINNIMSVESDLKLINYSIFETWKSGVCTIKHEELNEARKLAIKKALKKYSPEIINEAIKNYDLVLESSWYFNYKWSLEDFLNQKNALPNFTTEGSTWCSFQDAVKKNAMILPKRLQPVKEETPAVLKNFMDSIK